MLVKYKQQYSKVLTLTGVGIVSIFLLFYCFDYLLQVSISVFLPTIKNEFSINNFQLGLIGSVFFIYSFNIKTYNASSNLLTAQNPVLTWNERVEIYDNSIDEFPYLANYPRVELLNQMLLYWQYIEDNDIEFILKTADKYVEDG